MKYAYSIVISVGAGFYNHWSKPGFCKNTWLEGGGGQMRTCSVTCQILFHQIALAVSRCLEKRLHMYNFKNVH